MYGVEITCRRTEQAGRFIKSFTHLPFIDQDFLKERRGDRLFRIIVINSPEMVKHSVY